jgi:DNA-binding NarL/FixJ family response regulator
MRERYCLLPVPLEGARVSLLGCVMELTPAERHVLEYLGAGYSNKEIASLLGKAEPTIKNQVASCLRKLGVPTRARLIAALQS